MHSRLNAALAAVVMAFTSVGAAFSAPPSYYPADYQTIIEGSKSEQGLLIYSNISVKAWDPILKAFKAEYPWINVQTTDMRANEVFERYYADKSSGGATADILLAAAPQNWMEFLSKDDTLVYESPEKDKLPDWSKPAPGIYTVSADPFVIVWNKVLLPEDEWPASMQDIADLAAKHPEFAGKIGTYAPNASTYTQGIYWATIKRNGEKAFDWFKVLGPVTEPYRGTGPVLEKITTGEYMLGYFIVGLNLIPYVSNPASASLMGWALPKDAATFYMRNFAISKETKSPNSAKLMADFLLSKAGQTQVGIGGLLPYREDVDDPAAFRLGGMSFAKMVEQVGEENLIMIDFDPELMTGIGPMAKRLDQLFKEPQ